MKKEKYILGINSVYHESSACILRNGELVAFIEEERLNRRKHAKSALISNADKLPIKSIKYCIEKAGITFDGIDFIGFSIAPKERLIKNWGIENPTFVGEKGWGTKQGEELFYKKTLNVINKLSKLSGRSVRKKFFFIPHHLCHAYSAYFHSGYDSAAIVVIDGIAEFASTWIGYGSGKNIKKLYEVDYPNSLGFFWEKMSEYLGFTEYEAAKVMGLSSYGQSLDTSYSEAAGSLSGFGKGNGKLLKMQKIVRKEPDGKFLIDNTILRFRTKDFAALEKFFGVKKRNKGDFISQEHEDIAAAMQLVTEDILVHIAREAKKRTSSENLCLSGGVALNCVSNAKLIEKNIFENIYIEPTCNDAGTAIGAAFYIWCNKLKGARPGPIPHAFLGPNYQDPEILAALEKSNLEYKKVNEIEATVAKLLSQGKIIAFFQGAMEAGPRALGHRSILADPRNHNIREILNTKVKFRENFRPYCPSVLEKHAKNWFNVKKLASPTKYMLAAVEAKVDKKDKIPAVVHVDGTSRIQAVNKKDFPQFWKLINEFYKITGVPLVLNTSFNIQEPIVCSPQDAVNTFKKGKIDYLVMNTFLVKRPGEI